MLLPAPDSSWRQGSIIPVQLITSSKVSLTLSPPLESEGLVILISQDCDIVHHSYEAEPYVETLIARPLPPERRDGNLFHGKNPRQLQFALNTGLSEQLYMVNIHEKTRIHRKILLEGSPGNAQLDSVTIDLLTRWTAKRYTRAALPDEFNRRCRRAAERLKSRFKAKGNLITGVYLRLNLYEELSDTEDYKVIVYVAARPETCNNQEEEEIAISLVAEIERALNDCAGIEIVDAFLKSEEEISLHDLRSLKRWDYDSLSYRDEDIQSIAPDE